MNRHASEPLYLVIEIVNTEGDGTGGRTMTPLSLVKREMSPAIDDHRLPGPEPGSGLDPELAVPADRFIDLVDPDEHGVYLECHSP